MASCDSIAVAETGLKSRRIAVHMLQLQMRIDAWGCLHRDPWQLYNSKEVLLVNSTPRRNTFDDEARLSKALYKGSAAQWRLFPRPFDSAVHAPSGKRHSATELRKPFAHESAVKAVQPSEPHAPLIHASR